MVFILSHDSDTEFNFIQNRREEDMYGYWCGWLGAKSEICVRNTEQPVGYGTYYLLACPRLG